MKSISHPCLGRNLMSWSAICALCPFPCRAVVNRIFWSDVWWHINLVWGGMVGLREGSTLDLQQLVSRCEDSYWPRSWALYKYQAERVKNLPWIHCTSQTIIWALYHLCLENSLWVCSVERCRACLHPELEKYGNTFNSLLPKANSLSSKIISKWTFLFSPSVHQDQKIWTQYHSLSTTVW